MFKSIYFNYKTRIRKQRLLSIRLLYEYYKNKNQKIPTCYEKLLLGNCFYCFKYSVEILRDKLPDKLHNFMLLKYLEFKSCSYKNIVSKEFFWTNEYFNFLERPQDYSQVYLRYIFNKISHDEHGSNVFEYMAFGSYARDFINFNILKINKQLSFFNRLLYWFQRRLKWLLKLMKI